MQHIFAAIRVSEGEILPQEEVGRIVSLRRTEDDLSPLHVASLKGHADVVRALLVRLIVLFIHA